MFLDFDWLITLNGNGTYIEVDNHLPGFFYNCVQTKEKLLILQAMTDYQL